MWQEGMQSKTEVLIFFEEETNLSMLSWEAWKFTSETYVYQVILMILCIV